MKEELQKRDRENSYLDMVLFSFIDNNDKSTPLYIAIETSSKYIKVRLPLLSVRYLTLVVDI